ncbi:hypothetical protein Si103_02005 [Streptococcus infantarius subsp. infantarius]|nr:hypothetical protein [Streptococcus infantarius subsp. infantarius]MCO4536232.1 hypothetical protein [Streptococcus infantarius subsp. infantarius]
MSNIYFLSHLLENRMTVSKKGISMKSSKFLFYFKNGSDAEIRSPMY